MVLAPLGSLDEFGQEDPGHRGVLELVAARAAGHEEAGETGLVVQGNPVVGCIIQGGQADRTIPPDVTCPSSLNEGPDCTAYYDELADSFVCQGGEVSWDANGSCT